MSTVVSVHEFQLHPEVSSEAFERFMLQEWVPAWAQVAGMGISGCSKEIEESATASMRFHSNLKV